MSLHPRDLFSSEEADGSSRLISDPIWRHRGSRNYADHGVEGFKEACPYDEADIILTGSSHVYGTNLQRKEDWPYLLSANYGAKLYNGAMGAFSFLQYQLLLEKILSTRHRVCIIGIYSGFDVYASLKQAIEVGDARIPSLLGADPPASIDWSFKDALDSYIAEQKSLGVDIDTALASAYERGIGNIFPVFDDSSRLWIEPALRLKTQNLDHPFIEVALEYVNNALGSILSLATYLQVELRILIIPTKEWAVARQKVACFNELNQLKIVEDRMHARLREIAERYGVKAYSLGDLYCQCDLMTLFKPLTNDGHPSASGARLIAEYVASSGLISC